jgi:hypothetical protein
MTARDTYISSVNSAHNSAQGDNIAQTALPDAVAPPGNATGWSLTSAANAANAGKITQAQYVALVNSIAAWEQTQISIA